MERKEFTRFRLSDGREVMMREIIAGDVYNAMLNARHNQQLVNFHLIVEICLFNGQRISIEDVKGLSIADCNLIVEAIISQSVKI